MVETKGLKICEEKEHKKLMKVGDWWCGGCGMILDPQTALDVTPDVRIKLYSDGISIGERFFRPPYGSDTLRLRYILED